MAPKNPVMPVGRKMEPPKLATSAPYSPKYQVDPASPKQDVANKDHGATFKMPDKVSQKDIKDGSFKYGGGRSAGNRSLEDNRKMQNKQP